MSFVRRATLGAGTLIAAVAIAASPAAAQPSEQDTAWMVAAHQSNLAEIAAGTAAQEHATTEDVRDMGARLIEDHEALDADLTAAAVELGVELPGEPSPEQQAALAKVMAQDGEAFDTAWIASQIEGHRMTIAATEEEIANGEDPTVIALAEASAPVVQAHLDHLLMMGGDAPSEVPGGLEGPGTPTALGVSLLALGALAVTAALVLVLRPGRSRV